MEAINYQDLRTNLKKHLDKVSQDHETMFVVSGERKVVMMSLEEYNALNETAYLLQNPANANHLKESIQEAERGEVVKVSLEDI